jgi:hypothetical protein
MAFFIIPLFARTAALWLIKEAGWGDQAALGQWEISLLSCSGLRRRLVVNLQEAATFAAIQDRSLGIMPLDKRQQGASLSYRPGDRD